MSDPVTLLLVEDDASIRAALSAVLTREGYVVRAAGTLLEGRALATRHPPDVVVLDWMLPDGQGIDLLGELRRKGMTAPVVFLSARTDLVDKVLALELGADDYMTKPFEPRELVSRLRARLRGAKWAVPAAQDQLVKGDVTLSRERREVRRAGEVVVLTRMEFALLELLMDAPGRVFTREELLNRVWGYDSTPTTRTVDTHVLQLRTKLGAGLVESVRGVGYRVPAAAKEQAKS